MEVNYVALIGFWVVFVLMFFVPPLVVLTSKRVAGIEKALWAFGVLVTSWLGLLIYMSTKGGR